MSRVIKRVQYDPSEEGANVEIFYVDTVEVNGQVLETGNLIKKIINFSASHSQYAALMAYFQSQVDSDVENPVAPTPNWGAFNLSIFPLTSYQILRATTTNTDARNLAENIALTCGISRKDLDPSGYLFLQSQWNAFIQGLPNPPSEETISELNEIMENTNMKFSLDAEGLMVLAS